MEGNTPVGDLGGQPQELPTPQEPPAINESQFSGLMSSLQEDEPSAVSRVSFLQQDEQVCVDLTSDIAREIIMHLKIRLEKNGQQSQFD